ncbi:MAG: hypothetical protein IKU53_02415 [Firmicutes bacterium]|nr:hypothetical protein [Bacillota bacterium]
MKKEKSDLTVILVLYQIVYVTVMLWILPMLALNETLNAAITAVMTVTSAILIGKTYFEERKRNNVRGSLSLLSLCALVTVYVLYQCGLYS